MHARCPHLPQLHVSALVPACLHAASRIIIVVVVVGGGGGGRNRCRKRIGSSRINIVGGGGSIGINIFSGGGSTFDLQKLKIDADRRG
jgi:hypothetical protein